MNWDYIVVGAGSSGCALAHQLAITGRSVLIVEAGGSDWSPFIRFPAGVLRAGAAHDWGFKSAPDPTRNGAMEPWSRGRVLGGSSSINGTMYVRGAAEDFDRWAFEHGLSGWSAQEVQGIFREFESSDQSGPLRGHGGPLHVRTVRRPHATTEAFVQAAQRCGFAFNEDYNGASQQGVAYAQLSQRRGLRCSAADAFLKPLLGRKNIKLLLNASVQRIEVVNRRAVAVQLSIKGEPRRETARDIILSAGAIGSPKILMLSGIGPAEELHRHQIASVIDVPGVGRNLREHPLLKFVYRANIPTYTPSAGVRSKIDMLAKFVNGREGPISNLFEGVAFLRSSSSQPSADVQLHFLPVGHMVQADGTMQFTPYPSVTVLLNKSHPVSRGRMRLASANPEDAPLIECRILDAEADVRTLIDGVRTVRRIMSAPPIAALLEQEMLPGPAIDSDAALTDHIRSQTSIAFHPAGTCRMGLDEDAVVGPDLRVRGTENLWVADASVMPDLISGNTNAVCMMIGTKLGKQLAAEWNAQSPRRTATASR